MKTKAGKVKNKLQASLQFKLSLMFLMVMAISASVSVSLLLLIFSPIMRDNAEGQLNEMANSIISLESKTKFDAQEIVTFVANSNYSVKQVNSNDPWVLDNKSSLTTKSYAVNSEGVIPNATMVIQIRDTYYVIDSFSSDNMYWVVNFVIIVAFIACIAIGTLLTSFVGKTILQPIHDLSTATSEVARGNFKVRVNVPSDKEYGTLARNFNKMAEELSGTETLRGDFISSVSHEFKTPLASIQGFAKLLQSDDISEEDAKEYTQIIIDETSRLTKLSSNILRLTKLQNQKTIGRKTKFLLDEQMRNIILVLEPEWSKKNINFDIDLEEIRYIGNEELMAQIWQNIINNAIKFTPQNGNIGVKLYRGESGIVAEISDDGPNIPDEIKTKIFEKFYQGDKSRATEGNGLGLALVYRVVELCNGSVSVNNLSPTGVCFRIDLPYLIEDMM